MVTGAYPGGQFLQGLIGDTHNGPVSLAHLSFQAFHRGPEWLASPLAQRPAEGERRGGDAHNIVGHRYDIAHIGVKHRRLRTGTPQQNRSCWSGFSEMWLDGRPRQGWFTVLMAAGVAGLVLFFYFWNRRRTIVAAPPQRPGEYRADVSRQRAVPGADGHERRCVVRSS